MSSDFCGAFPKSDIELYNNDCLYQMTLIKSKSVDLVFCDLPYGETSCSWDSKIDLEAFWVEIDRITKPTTPIFFTTTTRYGAELIASNPKNFRYDLVWVKSASCGFLNAKKMPMRKHEMIYVFYKKLPYYDLSSHKHKFLESYVNLPKDISLNCYGECAYNNEYIGEAREANVYEPPLPVSVITTKSREDVDGLYGTETKKLRIFKDGKLQNDTYYEPPLPVSVIRDTTDYQNNSELYGKIDRPDFMRKNGESNYDPPLPNSILEIKSEKGKHSTQKPVALVEWILKYYSKKGDLVLDPTMGSGSTGVACKLMGRRFIGIEKNEDIFKYAVERIHSVEQPAHHRYSGETATIQDIAGNIMPPKSDLIHHHH